MRIKLPVRAGRIRLKKDEPHYVVLKELDQTGSNLLTRLFEKKKQWEEYNKKEFFLWIEFDLRHQRRTFKQNSTVWKLVECIWLSMEKDPPTEEEKYSLYLDLLEAYADKVKSRISGELRPVHISESNSIEGARFIDGLLYHLTTIVGELDYGTQSTVFDVLQEWQQWRGGLEIDPMDYSDLECTKPLTYTEWRERHKVSEASGHGGQIELAHIVSRGSDSADIEKPWNWLALTHEEHALQHSKGWDNFLRIYPHLKGRVDRARKLAKKLELDFKDSQRAVYTTGESLAMEALNG